MTQLRCTNWDGTRTWPASGCYFVAPISQALGWEPRTHLLPELAKQMGLR